MRSCLLCPCHCVRACFAYFGRVSVLVLIVFASLASSLLCASRSARTACVSPAVLGPAVFVSLYSCFICSPVVSSSHNPTASRAQHCEQRTALRAECYTVILSLSEESTVVERGALCGGHRAIHTSRGQHHDPQGAYQHGDAEHTNCCMSGCATTRRRGSISSTSTARRTRQARARRGLHIAYAHCETRRATSMPARRTQSARARTHEHSKQSRHERSDTSTASPMPARRPQRTRAQ